MPAPSRLIQIVSLPFRGALNARLARAIRDADVGRARQLLKAGADPNCELPYGLTPLTANHTHQDAACEAMALALIEAGADVDKPNASGMRPLHYAALFGLSSLCSALLSRGADAEAPNKEGQGPVEHMRGFYADHPGSLGDEQDALRREMIAALFERSTLGLASHGAGSAPRRARL